MIIFKEEREREREKVRETERERVRGIDNDSKRDSERGELFTQHSSFTH